MEEAVVAIRIRRQANRFIWIENREQTLYIVHLALDAFDDWLLLQSDIIFTNGNGVGTYTVDKATKCFYGGLLYGANRIFFHLTFWMHVKKASCLHGPHNVSIGAIVCCSVGLQSSWSSWLFTYSSLLKALKPNSTSPVYAFSFR